MTAQVLQYGTFTRGKEIIRPEPNSPSGRIRRTQDDPLLAQTRNIPMVQGTKFGFCFGIENAPQDGHIELAARVTHPELKRADGRTSTSYSVPQYVQVSGKSGSACVGYGLDSPFELVPGAWTFVIAYQGVDLLKQEFVVQ